MYIEGNAAVLEVLREKKRLMEQGLAHDHIRPLLFICGGMMRGVYGGGAVTALYERGYGDVFDHVVGISAGAPTAAYFLSGQPRVGTSIFYEECASRLFLSLRRFSNPLNARYLISIFRSSPRKKLDANHIFNHRSKLLLATASYETGASHFPEHRSDRERLLTILHAAVAMPGLCTDSVILDGERHVDGGCAEPLPAHLIAKLNATHVVVIANRNPESLVRGVRVETFLWNLLFGRRVSRPIRQLVRSRLAGFRNTVEEMLSEQPVPVAVVWGDGGVSGISRSTPALRAAAVRSEEWWSEHLNGHV